MQTRAKVRVRSFPLSVPCDPTVRDGGRRFGANWFARRPLAWLRAAGRHFTLLEDLSPFPRLDHVVRRLARTEGGDDLKAREAWYEANKVQGNETWNWSSDVARQEFATKRSDAQNSFKKSRNMIGLAVVNRVVAMIDAVLLSGRVEGSAYRLDMSQERDGGELVSRIALRRSVP